MPPFWDVLLENIAGKCLVNRLRRRRLEVELARLHASEKQQTVSVRQDTRTYSNDTEETINESDGWSPSWSPEPESPWPIQICSATKNPSQRQSPQIFPPNRGFPTLYDSNLDLTAIRCPAVPQFNAALIRIGQSFHGARKWERKLIARPVMVAERKKIEVKPMKLVFEAREAENEIDSDSDEQEEVVIVVGGLVVTPAVHKRVGYGGGLVDENIKAAGKGKGKADGRSQDEKRKDSAFEFEQARNRIGGK